MKLSEKYKINPMKTKHLLLKSFLLFTVGILNIQQVKSQIVGTDAFLKGNYVEIGIKGNGGYEGATATAPTEPVLKKPSDILFQVIPLFSVFHKPPPVVPI